SRSPGLRRSGDDRSTSAVRPWRMASIIGNLVTDPSGAEMGARATLEPRLAAADGRSVAAWPKRVWPNPRVAMAAASVLVAAWASVSVSLTPRGPVTTAQDLWAMGSALIVGVLAGYVAAGRRRIGGRSPAQRATSLRRAVALRPGREPRARLELLPRAGPEQRDAGHPLRARVLVHGSGECVPRIPRHQRHALSPAPGDRLPPGRSQPRRTVLHGARRTRGAGTGGGRRGVVRHGRGADEGAVRHRGSGPPGPLRPTARVPGADETRAGAVGTSVAPVQRCLTESLLDIGAAPSCHVVGPRSSLASGGQPIAEIERADRWPVPDVHPCLDDLVPGHLEAERGEDPDLGFVLEVDGDFESVQAISRCGRQSV